MTPKRDAENILDQIIDDIRQQQPDETTAARAAERVWSQLNTGVIANVDTQELRSCEDFQALIPAYQRGELSEARRLLVADHVPGCVVCRRVLNQDERSTEAAAARLATSSSVAYWKWLGAAAALILVAGLAQMGLFSTLFVQPVWAQLESSNGPVYQMVESGPVRLAAGERIEVGQPIRTARGVAAEIRLSDGSLVEMDERSELVLSSDFSGNSIALRRGNIIVEAAAQGSDHLFVTTDELDIAVKGTVFTVSHGMKGSRVGVIEGEVLVSQAGSEERTLVAGQQHTSRIRLASAGLREEISWSPNLQHHLALLAELSALQYGITEALNSDQLRYSSTLLGVVPANTVIFGAFPNISGKLQETFQEFRDSIANNPNLGEWYAANVGPEQELVIQLGLDRMRSYGSQLGEEIVVALSSNAGGGDEPVLIAETLDEQAFRDLVHNDLGFVQTLAEEQLPVQLISSPEEASGDGLFILVASGMAIVSPSARLLAEVADNAVSGSAFSEQRFSTTVEGAYAEGVDWLLAVDLSRLADLNARVADNTLLTMLGIQEIQDLLVERKAIGGVTDNRAVMTFSQVEEGLLSWVAEPGPMAGLEFVSPDAQLAAGFVVKEPAEMVDRLFNYLQTSDLTSWTKLLQLQDEIGLDIRNDLAAPMGGEIVIAVDGPVLPEPSWKLIAEVYDRDVLQQSLLTIVDIYNARRAAEDPVVTLTIDNAGANHYVLQMGEGGPSIEYRYSDGYLIVGPNREVIDRAIQFRQTGYSLSTSPKFVDLLPQGTTTQLSALFYNDLSSLLGPLAGRLSQIVGELAPEQEAALGSLAGDAGPMMVSLFAEPGRVTVASTGDLDMLWFNLAALGNLGGPAGLADILSSPGTN